MSIAAGTRTGLMLIEGDTARRVLRGPTTALTTGPPWLAVVEGRSVVTSNDLEAWEGVGAVPNGVSGRSVLSGSGGLLVGTSEARLLRRGERGLVFDEAFDGVDGRGRWYTPWGGPPDTRSLSEAINGTLFVNVHVGGIPRTRDGGETWEPTIDVDADVHQVLAHPTDSARVFAATAYGLAVSDDEGDTWRFETDGLHADYCRAVATGGDVLFLSASRSHRGEQGAVYRRALGSTEPFERCTDGLPEWFDGNVDSHCLAAGGTTVVIGAPDGTVFESTDAGQTWRQAATGLGHITCVALT